MKNKIQVGDQLTLTAPYDVASGAGCKVGSLFGVAVYDVASGAEGEFQLVGVYDLPKAAGAVTQGALLYWDDTAKLLTTTDTANTLVGKATQDQASGDATARIRLG